MKITTILALTFSSLLSACSSIPSHLIVAPDIISTPRLNYGDKQVQLEVIDMRTANHIVQILQEDEAAILMSAQIRLEDTIKQTLTNQWKKQGLQVSSLATNTIKIAIEKTLISVNQQTIKYQSQTEIILKVIVNNGHQTLTSTFKNRGDSKGPLHADIAVLERNFNQRLANLLTQILANEKINTFIK